MPSMILKRKTPGAEMSINLTAEEVRAIYEAQQLEYDKMDVHDEVESYVMNSDYPDAYLLSMMNDDNWICKVAKCFRNKYDDTAAGSDQRAALVANMLEESYPAWYVNFCNTYKPKGKEES